MTTEPITAQRLTEDFSWITSASQKGDEMHLECRYQEITFDELSKLAVALGTTHIDMTPESGNDGFCDTCDSPYTMIMVRVKGAKFHVDAGPRW